VFLGDIIAVNTPGGETIELEVPEGVAPGDQFEVRISIEEPDQEQELDELAEAPADGIDEEEQEEEFSDEEPGSTAEMPVVEQPPAQQPVASRDFVLLVLPNGHVATQRKVRLQATSLDELGESLGEAVGVVDAVVCAPSDTISDEAMYTSLDDIPEKAKVMVWPAAAFVIDLGEQEHEQEQEDDDASVAATASSVATTATSLGLGPPPAQASPRPADATAAAPTDFTLMVMENELVPTARKIKCTAATLEALLEHVQQKIGSGHAAAACGLSIAVEDGAEPIQLVKLADVPAKGRVQLWPLVRFQTSSTASPKKHKLKKGKAKPPPPRKTA